MKGRKDSARILLGSLEEQVMLAVVRTRNEAYGMNVNVLIATGLILFAITFVINSIARVVINRRKAFSGAN